MKISGYKWQIKSNIHNHLFSWKSPFSSISLTQQKRLSYFFLNIHLFIYLGARASTGGRGLGGGAAGGGRGRCQGRSSLPAEQGARLQAQSQDSGIKIWGGGRHLTHWARPVPQKRLSYLTLIWHMSRFKVKSIMQKKKKRRKTILN